MKKENQNQEEKKNVFIAILLVIIIVLILLCLKTKIGENINASSSTQNQTQNQEIQENNTNTNEDKPTTSYISKEKALDIALQNANLNRETVYDISVEFDFKYGKTVYEVDFDNRQYEYEYYIDATTGDILHSFKDRD